MQVTGGTDTPAGLGIGLALSRQLIEKHGGSVRALSSGNGQGSTFEVRFAALGEGEEVQHTRDEIHDLNLPRGLKVLVVEDNQDLARTMTMLLDTRGCEVFHAETGRKGLEVAREEAVDVMLVDIGLPDISGYDVARAIRQEGLECRLIAHSGYSHETARRKSAEAGFDHHLAKPLDLKQFQEVIAASESS